MTKDYEYYKQLKGKKRHQLFWAQQKWLNNRTEREYQEKLGRWLKSWC